MKIIIVKYRSLLQKVFYFSLMVKNKRKKINIFIIAFLSVVLFATGAVCTNCGSDQAENEKIGVETDQQAKDDEVGQEETIEDEQEEETPSVELSIYEGPLYSEPDDICFYRIEAVLEGFNDPVKIDFSKDDSNGAWGENKVQVNLERGQKYTLTATVTDGEHTDEATIELEWECDDNTPQGEILVNSPPIIEAIILPPGALIVNSTVDIAAVVIDPENDEINYRWSVGAGSLSDESSPVAKWNLPGSPGNYVLSLEVEDSNGNISTEAVEANIVGTPDTSLKEKGIINQQSGSISDEGFIDNSSIVIGHSSDGKDYKGYISFDISDLYGKNIRSARLILTAANSWGPRDDFGNIMLGTIDFGNSPLTASASSLPSNLISSMPSSNINLDISSETLINSLKIKISEGRPRFQLKIYYQYPNAYDDAQPHGVSYTSSGILLRIEYSE